MYKLWQSIRKEVLLLSRDWGGLVILFVMPLVLVITVTLIQDSSFKAVSTKIEIAFVDKDGGFISQSIIDNLAENESYVLVTEHEGVPFEETELEQLVFKGRYQLGLVIPDSLSMALESKVNQNVEKVISTFGFPLSSEAMEDNSPQIDDVKLYFDPATHISFKSGVKNAIDKIVTQIENRLIYGAFQEQLSDDGSAFLPEENYISFKEILPPSHRVGTIPNAVQHNVPAWSLFAIFFIVVPLSINLVKEKNQGTNLRILTSPTPYWILLGGKIITYLIICLLQFYVMLLIGKFVFPYFGLIALEWVHLGLLTLVALVCGLAAIGFGVLLGTLARTQEQSAPFGATSVIIMAALGGVWVPVFAMPEIIQVISGISPMNWGLNAFYDVLLRQGGFGDILTKLILLLLFFIGTITISVLYDKKKRAV